MITRAKVQIFKGNEQKWLVLPSVDLEVPEEYLQHPEFLLSVACLEYAQYTIGEIHLEVATPKTPEITPDTKYVH